MELTQSTPLSMNTFNLDNFTKQAVSDLGSLAVGRQSVINLIPFIPGMGLLTSLKNGAQDLNSQGIRHGVLELLDAQSLLDFQTRLDVKNAESGARHDKPQIVIIDGAQSTADEETRAALVDFLKETAQHASVWYVGTDVEALTKALPEQTRRFGLVARSRISTSALPEKNNVVPIRPQTP